MVAGLSKLSYKERLLCLKLPTLRFRRLRGDLIEVYKIVTKKYDVQVCFDIPFSTNVQTRGNSFKLTTERSRYDLRKYSFTPRIVALWNSLPESIVNERFY